MGQTAVLATKPQEVDFLKGIIKPPNKLPALLIGVAGVVWLLFLMACSLIMGIYQRQQAQVLVEVKQERANAVKAYQQLAKTYPLLASETKLVEKVAAYEALVLEKKERYSALTHTTLRKPFSGYMRALAKTAPKGLWITNMNVDEDSGNISLAGYTAKPVYVTVFLQKLQEVAPYRGTAFDLFSVNEDKKRGYIKFEVATDQLLHDES